MNVPRFSVLIPSYNRPELLVPTIESILAQTEPDFEVIVSDDASPRGAEIAMAVARFEADARFKFILQEKNLGWSNNRNALLDVARGDYVLLLGDDDLMPRHALASLTRQLRVRPDSDLIAFGYEVIDLDGRHVYTRCCPNRLTLSVGRDDGWREVFRFDVLPMWAFHPFTLCCKRTLACEWRYDPKCGIGDDVFFLFRALDSGCRIDVLPEVLFSWRRAMKQTRGYVNLSSSSAANDKARCAIWGLAQSFPWQRTEVAKYVRSREFAQYFLRLAKRVAADVVALGSYSTPESLAAAQERAARAGSEERWQASKLEKLWRIHRLGGLRYVYHSCKSTWLRTRVEAMRS